MAVAVWSEAAHIAVEMGLKDRFQNFPKRCIITCPALKTNNISKSDAYDSGSL